MSDYSYPEELIKKTEKRIRTQIQGNGLDSKDITVTVKRQGLGTFTARTSYKVDCKVDTTNANGKVVDGTLVGQGELQSSADQAVQKIQSDTAMQDVIEAQIQKLPLEGFGSHKQTIPLAQTKQSFTEHKTCGSCQGQKQTTCHTCHGQARSNCPMCNAQGVLQCMTCGGQGQTRGQDGNMQLCMACQGKRQTYCTQCNGQQLVPCGTCQAKGVIICRACGGEGASSQIMTVEAFAVTNAHINVQELDNEPKRIASKVGTEKLASGGHIDIALMKKPEAKEDNSAWYEDSPTHDTSGVYYMAKMPWAVAEACINGKPYDIAFAGKKGAVAETKSFMDEVLKKPRTLLKQAASGDGFVTGLLKDACEYRVSRETLAAVVKGHKKRAMQSLMKSYGLGLSQSVTKSLVIDAYSALKRVTRRPRYIGLGVGLTLAAALFYAWFGMDNRSMTTNQPDKIRYLIDFIMLFIGLGVSFGTVKGGGFIALKSVMRDIGLPIKQIPAAGTAGMYAIVGSIILWGGVFWLSIIG